MLYKVCGKGLENRDSVGFNMRFKYNFLCFFIIVLAGLNAMAQYTTLPEDRLLFLNDYDDLKWEHTGEAAPPKAGVKLLFGTFHRDTVNGWYVHEGRTGYAGASYGRVIPPYITDNYAANLRNVAGSMVESPYYTNGVGTLYFDAVNADDPEDLYVYIATNMNDLTTGGVVNQMEPVETATLTYNWIQVDIITLNFSLATDFGRYSYPFNYAGAAKLKIVRENANAGSSNKDNQFVVIDNIQVSYPFEYVIMTELDSELISNPDFSSGSLNVSCQLDKYNNERAVAGSTVSIEYRTAPTVGGNFGSWVALQLNYVTGSGNGETGLEYQGSVIVASEGEIEYYYSCTFDGYYVAQDYTGTGIKYPYPSEAVSPAKLYEDGMGGADPFDYNWEFGTFPPETELPDNRILLFADYDDWVHSGEDAPPKAGKVLLDGTYHSRADGWEISETRTGYSGGYGNVVPLKDLANKAGNLRNVAGAMIESPFYGDGVGTLYLEAVNGAAPVDLHIYIATNMWDTNLWQNVDVMLPEEDDIYTYNWVEIDVLNLNYATQGEFIRYYQTLNYRGAARVKFVREFEIEGRPEDDQFLVIDNIRISPPPTDVVIDKTEALTNPGYPTADSDFTVRCYVSNADTNVSTDLRSVFLVHRWRYLDQQVDPWKTQLMNLIDPGDGGGNGELYELTIPAANQVGDIEYYFSSSFVGYVYQSQDYTELGYEYPSENLSPRELRGDAAGDGEYFVRLREYDSDYGAIYVVSDQHSEPIKMELVGDHKWRGMVPLGGIAPTNVSWNLKAEKEYFDGSESYKTNLIYWSSTSAASSFDPVLPYGGVFGETNASKKLTLKVDDGGYMKVDFDTRTLEFLATRAEYQNFNAWPARDDYFSDSSGQSDKQRFENTFDDFSLSDYRTFFEYFTTLEDSTGFMRGPFETPGRWLAGAAANVEERTIDVNHGPAGYDDYRNRSLRLKGGDPLLGLGYVYNQALNLPDGLQYIKFKARAGQVVSNNTEICYYRNYFAESGYAVTLGKAYAAVKSPEYPYLSVITYYQDYNNFYEFRVVQEPDTDNENNVQRDARVSLHVLKWVNGVAEELKITTPNQDLSISQELIMKVTMTPIVEGGTTIKGEYHDQSISVDDTSATALTHGTFGVRSSDCAASFGLMNAVSSGGSTTAVIGPTASDITAQIPDWFIPLDVYEMKSNVVPLGIHKTPPDQKLNVYLQATDYELPDAPLLPGAPEWILARQVDILNYSYQSVSVEVKSWQAQFVMLQVGDGDGDVAVDELEISSWRAASIGDETLDDSWYATGAWIKNIGGAQGQILEMDHTRTDPAEKQVLRSLYLDNGIGLMEFDYRVLNGPAKLVVQYATEGEPGVWVDILTIDVSGVSGWVHATAYKGDSGHNGWMRVLNDRGVGYNNALVEINNAVVWDEPYVNEKSWLAYNAKVSAADPIRLLLDESKGCFLNNSQTEDTYPVLLDQDAPNLQSPLLVNGLGTLTFQARAYNKNEAATVYVYASTNGWSANPEPGTWVLIKRFDDINSEYYKTYSYKPFEGSGYDALRLETEIGSRRACIEEVVISEPVFPGFDITDVKLGLCDDYGEFSDHPQPLSFDEMHVEAKVSNQQLSPSNIVLYVSYYVGDDVWGVDNWWTSPDIVTKRMHPVDGEDNLYRTRNDEGDVPGLSPTQIGGIVGQAENAVVQYRVWATHREEKSHEEYQEEFINPEWYYPIDINQERSNEGWSPYYFVFGVTEAAVWINEINIGDSHEDAAYNTIPGIWQTAYIEIAVPAWLDLGGWSVELVNGESGYDASTVIKIPGGLPPQSAVTNGYAFFVIADDDPPSRALELKKTDLKYNQLSVHIPNFYAGGLRLVRPGGMYEQIIAYDDESLNFWGNEFSGTNWAGYGPSPEGEFIYIGEEGDGGSLSKTGDYDLDSTNTWDFPLFPLRVPGDADFASNYTPGAPNGLQPIPDANDFFPGASNALVRSSLNQLRATQNGRRLLNYSLRVPIGLSSNIVYNVDPWYQLVSVKSNNVEQLSPGSAYSSYTFEVNDIQGDLDVQAQINLREDLSSIEGNTQVLDWVLGFGEGPLVPMFYDGDILSLTEQFWLDADPTVTNDFRCVIKYFSIDTNSDIHVRLHMDLNGNNLTNIQGGTITLKLQGKEELMADKWDLLIQYYLTADSFGSNNECLVFISNPFDFMVPEYDLKSLFLRWVIEEDEPRVMSYPLENQEAP